jgi:hypothetical protein
MVSKSFHLVACFSISKFDTLSRAELVQFIRLIA